MRAGRPLLHRLARIVITVMLLAIAMPLLLTLLYLVLPPVSTLMMWRFATARPVERTFVPLERISPNLVAAVTASEDARFCRHGGVDWPALFSVVEDADDGGPSRGASTIPMQTAKNLFLWPGRSYVRKALEIPLALLSDLIWSKRRMLEIYLNIAEWGDGVFGAEAGARRAFGKSAAQLTPREAALMATALPNPIRRDPGKPSAGHRALAANVAGRADDMREWLDCLR